MTASRKFVVGPASAISTRCQRGFERNSSGSPRALFGGIVARHANVAAQRQRADAVIGGPAAHAPEARTEADREDVHAHAKQPRHDEVAPLVDQDHQAQADGRCYNAGQHV